MQPSEAATRIAASLLAGEARAILLGNAAAQHPQASQLHAAAQWLADHTGARIGYLTEGGNTVGGYLAQALPGKDRNAQQLFLAPRKAYLLLNVEPELDVADPQLARAALQQADMVVAMSAYKHAAEYADVLLPIAPFTETSGTFVNCEGRAQSFNGTVKPLGDTRPGWKVLRVLGNLLELENFEYETSEAIRNEVLGADAAGNAALTARLNNIVDLQPQVAAPGAGSALERIADVPIYFSDAIVRRSLPLQQTRDARAPRAVISAALAQKLAVADGDPLNIAQGQHRIQLAAEIDPALPDNVVRVAAAHATTAALGAMFGALSVEKA